MSKATGVGRGHGGCRRWTDAEDRLLAEQYAVKAATEVASALGRTTGAVYLRAAKLGLRRPSGMNYRPYFASIDSPMKAYVLGLLAADGWVDDEGRIGIEVNAKDWTLAATVRDELSPSGRVRYYERNSPIRGKIHHRVMARFQVGSVEMARELAQYGIVPRKTHTLIWPALLPTEFDNSFICGYMDGDGHMSYQNEQPYWTITGAVRDFIGAIREHIEAATPVRPFGPYRQADLWAVTKAGQSVRVLDDWLHRDVPGLARKRLSRPGQGLLF